MHYNENIAINANGTQIHIVVIHHADDGVNDKITNRKEAIREVLDRALSPWGLKVKDK